MHAIFTIQITKSILALEPERCSANPSFLTRLQIDHLGFEALLLAPSAGYMRTSMSAQSQASVPPAPAWIVRKAFSESCGPWSKVKSSIRSNSF